MQFGQPPLSRFGTPPSRELREELRIEALADFFDRFFTVDVSKVDMLNPNDFKAKMWGMLVDNGLNRQVTWKSPAGEVMFAPRLTMTNRVGLINRIVDNYLIKDNVFNDDKFQVLMLDVKDFGAYNIQDENNALGGDYMANIIAHSIKMTCIYFLNNLKNRLVLKELALNLISDQKQRELERREINKLMRLNITPARYGGDEFAILIDGGLPDDILEELKVNLMEDISSLEGYYKTNQGEVVKRNVDVKNNQIDVISPPEDPDAAKIFISFLNNNILLNSEELKKIQEDPEVDISKVPTKILYPKNSKGNELTLEAKLRWITSKQSLYSDMIEQVTKLDKHYGGDKYKTMALHFFERTLYNDIFKHKMVSYRQFIESIPGGPYRAICVFDVVWLKEMNDINMARGDYLLMDFFNKIKLVFDAAGYTKFRVTRRGGTFIIGIYEVNNLSEVLENIRIEMNKGLNVVIMGQSVSVPCGYSVSRVESNSRQNNADLDSRNQYEKSNDLVSSIRNQAEKQKINNLCESLLRDPKCLTQLTELLTSKLEYTKNTNNFDLADGWMEGWFWLNYLTGKLPLNSTVEEQQNQAFSVRYIERCQTIKDKIRLLKMSYAYQFVDVYPIIKILEKIISKMKAVHA
jgi:hypothetical protein